MARQGRGSSAPVQGLGDYHVIETAAIHTAVEFLLEHQPPNVHLVVCTRQDPPLLLAQLRVRASVSEIRADDLRFMPDEAMQFFAQTMNLAKVKPGESTPNTLMSATTSTIPETRPTQPAPWWEIVIVILLYLLFAHFIKGLEIILSFLLLIYMLIEGRLRQRTWADYGFSLRTIPAGLRKTLGWALLVIFGAQVFFVFGEYFFLPQVFQHIAARLPFDLNAVNANLVITLVIGAFLEELVFRGLFQNRLSAFVAPAAAIGLAALTFALAHYSPGPLLVVFVDLLSVFVDGVIYGVIYQRSRNIFVAWIPHFLGDVVALCLLLALK